MRFFDFDFGFDLVARNSGSSGTVAGHTYIHTYIHTPYIHTYVRTYVLMQWSQHRGMTSSSSSIRITDRTRKDQGRAANETLPVQGYEVPSTTPVR